MWTSLLNEDDQRAFVKEVLPLQEEMQACFTTQAGNHDPSMFPKIVDIHERMGALIEAWRVSTLLAANESWRDEVGASNARWALSPTVDCGSIGEIRAELA